MIRVKNLTLSRGGKPVLSGLSLDIHPGDRILIAGESGAGKSTLLKALLLFEPEADGAIFWNGNPVDPASVTNYRRQIGYVSQEPGLFRGSVEDFFKSPFGFRANKGRVPDGEIVEARLEMLGFDNGILGKKFESLSGGERQRLTLIQTLLLERPIYIFDEVTSQLDHENRIRAIRAAVSNGQAQTIVSVSHDKEWLEFPSFDVWKLENGHLIRIKEAD